MADDQGNLKRDPQNGQPFPDGTGFFVSVKSKDPSRIFLYLVTARHVILDTQGSRYPRVFVRLNRKGGNAEFAGLDLSRVFLHQDSTVDIAVIPVSINTEYFDIKSIPEDFLTSRDSFEDLHIREGSDVFFAGLFAQYYGDHSNNVLFRFGHVAMFPEGPISWRDSLSSPIHPERLYLLETQAYGGNSGSPVFFYLGAEREPGQLYLAPPVIKLAGVLKGFFGSASPLILQQSSASVVPFSMQNIGIAAVTPSYLLREILFSEEVKHFRDDDVLEKSSRPQH